MQECNIFENISSDEELNILDMIGASMAATDLSVAHENWKTFTDLVHCDEFNWSNSKHKGLFR